MIATPANMNMVPWNANISYKNGMYFVVRNELNQTRNPQNETPKSFILSGIISAITKKGNVSTAQDAMNIVNETLATGIQLTVSTS